MHKVVGQYFGLLLLKKRLRIVVLVALATIYEAITHLSEQLYCLAKPSAVYEAEPEKDISFDSLVITAGLTKQIGDIHERRNVRCRRIGVGEVAPYFYSL